jgi:excisionase family DNA binding protein
MSTDSEANQQAPPGQDRGGGPQSQVDELRFLTVAEVARTMRVSKMTVYRLVHAGELPAARVGRSFRVAESDVHAYLESAYNSAG